MQVIGDSRKALVQRLDDFCLSQAPMFYAVRSSLHVCYTCRHFCLGKRQCVLQAPMLHALRLPNSATASLLKEVHVFK